MKDETTPIVFLGWKQSIIFLVNQLVPLHQLVPHHNECEEGADQTEHCYQERLLVQQNEGIEEK